MFNYFSLLRGEFLNLNVMKPKVNEILEVKTVDYILRK